MIPDVLQENSGRLAVMVSNDFFLICDHKGMFWSPKMDGVNLGVKCEATRTLVLICMHAYLEKRWCSVLYR